MDDDIKCPFCHEDGFDLVGLKQHLLNWCPEFEDVETIEEERIRKKKEKGG